MPTHYAEPITEYWLDEVNRGEKKAQSRKRRIFLRILFILYNWFLYTIFRDAQVDHWYYKILDVYFIYSMLLYPIMIAIYVSIEESRVGNELNDRLKKNIENVWVLIPENYKIMHSELLDKFNISDNKITRWIDMNNLTANITSYYFKKKYHLIISLGFIGLTGDDIESAKVIYAHELCHIRQKDPINIIFEKFNSRIHLLFWRIPEIAFLIFSICMLLIISGHVRSNVYYNLRMQNEQLRFYITDLCWVLTIQLFYLVRAVYGALNFSKKAFDCERNADIGTSLLYGTRKLEKCLNDHFSDLSPNGKILPKAPSLKWRINEIINLQNHFPELRSINDEKDSILPKLGELR
ncbi:MAG: hypothetical protein INR73_05990 [Williamsia sp.]|nr:hypothetical protein [Williamsia sp.]